MKMEKLRNLIAMVLNGVLGRSNDTLIYEINDLPHNGAEVQLKYIYADKLSKSGYSSVECAEPIKVYGVEGAENIRRKLENFYAAY